MFEEPDLRSRSDRHKKIYAAYELIYTFIDFLAGMLFVAGSIFFFSSELQRAGTWCFLIGSVFFAAKPSLRVIREIHLVRIGDYEDLASRF